MKKPRARYDKGIIWIPLSTNESIPMYSNWCNAAGLTIEKQYKAGLNLLKEASCNLVLANDTITRQNMIIVPEEAKYNVTTNRYEVLSALVEMALARYGLNYTRTEVVEGDRIQWDSSLIPDSLRTVVNYCIDKGAYKPFRGKTAGHFAVRPRRFDGSPLQRTIYTTPRGEDFNKLRQKGLLHVDFTQDDRVVAFGAKPSVGGMSQKIIFEKYQDLDCIVHFHCPTKIGSPVNVREQKPYECGSHECGINTAEGLVKYDDDIYAVMLDNHGPNIVFKRDTDPKKVINFIEQNWDLSDKTGGRLDMLDDAV